MFKKLLLTFSLLLITFGSTIASISGVKLLDMEREYATIKVQSGAEYKHELPIKVGTELRKALMQFHPTTNLDRIYLKIGRAWHELEEPEKFKIDEDATFKIG